MMAIKLRYHARTFAKAIAALALASAFAALFSCSHNAVEPQVDPETQEVLVGFSHDSGIYPNKSLEVQLVAPEGYTIAYTIDSRTPTAEHDSGKQKLTVTLDGAESGHLAANKDLILHPDVDHGDLLENSGLPSGCVLRAALIDSFGKAGKPTTKVYFLDIDFAKRFPGCLVFSIVTDLENLMDYETGIMVIGKVYDEWKETEEGRETIAAGMWYEYETNATQHGKSWERPCFVQLYDESNVPAIEADAGMRVSGGISRMFSQKSFNLYFRDDYGLKWFNYKLFDGAEQYRSFRLRDGGNNTHWLKFKDVMLLDLASGLDYAAAQSRPAVLFLNGEYWGPYLLSERVSDQMVADHFDVDTDQVIIFKDGELEDGIDEDVKLYDELMSYANQDLTDLATWQEFCSKMDIQSFADFCATEVYIGNWDWSTDKNVVLWRTRDASYNDGKWQYILYDIEYSSGVFGDARTAVDWNHFQSSMERYPLFAAAIQNQEFYELFLNSLKEVGSVNFAPEHVDEVMQTYLDTWLPLMDDFYKRYGNTSDLWDFTIQRQDDFFAQRYDIIIPIVEAWGEEQFSTSYSS